VLLLDLQSYFFYSGNAFQHDLFMDKGVFCSDRTFSFVVNLPHSRFTFTHHMQPIIKEVDSNVEAEVDLSAMAVEVYDRPSSREYVKLIEA